SVRSSASAASASASSSCAPRRSSATTAVSPPPPPSPDPQRPLAPLNGGLLARPPFVIWELHFPSTEHSFSHKEPQRHSPPRVYETRMSANAARPKTDEPRLAGALRDAEAKLSGAGLALYRSTYVDLVLAADSDAGPVALVAGTHTRDFPY